MEPEPNIYLFVPNLIGYGRIVLAVAACITMLEHPLLTLTFYFLSAFLDAFDGYAARLYNQSTKFGALLDQLTDRCGTLCLLMGLSVLYPRYLFWLQMSAVLDIASHWIHSQVSLMCGRSSHKFISAENDSIILYWYYTNRPILFTLCFLNEFFYVSFYLWKFFEGPSVFGIGFLQLTTYISLPFALIKSWISLLQLLAASSNCKKLDIAERRTAAATTSHHHHQRQN